MKRRGRPKGSLNKKGKKVVPERSAPFNSGETTMKRRGRPKGSLNKNGRKTVRRKFEYRLITPYLTGFAYMFRSLLH